MKKKPASERLKEDLDVIARLGSDRPGREALIASGDIDPEDSMPVEDHVALRRVVLALKAERERRGLSLADLSVATGMTAPALSNLETGKNPNPTVNTLLRYARALGKTLKLTID